MGAALLVASILLSAQDAAAPPDPASAARPEVARQIAPAARKIGASSPAAPSPVGFVVWTFAVLGAMAGAAALLRRFLGKSKLFAASGPIAVVARRSIGPRQELILVDVGGRVLLIGATRERLTTLGEFGNRDQVAGGRESLPENVESGRRDREPLQALGA